MRKISLLSILVQTLALLLLMPAAASAAEGPAFGQPQLRILDVSERAREGRNSIAVTLSAPLDPATDFQPFLSVYEKGGAAVDGAWILDPSHSVLWFPHTQPDRSYEVTVYGGLTAANGARLGDTRNFQIETRDLEPLLSFDTDGAFLPAGLSNGLPVVAVNIAAADVDFFRVRPEHFIEFFSKIDDARRSDWYLNQVIELTDLAYSGRFDLDPPENTRTRRTLAVEDIPAVQAPGLYLAVMREPGAYDDKQVTWFTVTDLGLHARFYDNRLDVHAASLKTGKPLAGVELGLITSKGQVNRRARTSPEGVGTFMDPAADAQLLVALNEPHIALIELKRPALDLNDFDLGRRPQLPVEVFVYGPRDLYRPGETVQFSALLRDGDGRGAHAPVLPAKIMQPDGTVVHEFKWHPGEQGYYGRSYELPENAATGRWSLQLGGVLKKPVTYEFLVEDFLPERMELILGPEGRERLLAAPDQTLEIPVQGAYLYGAPAAGNRLEARVHVAPWRQAVPELKGFEFGNAAESGLAQQFETEALWLDDAGRATLEIPSAWAEAASPLKVKVIASLFESGGRPVTRSYPALIWPGGPQLGIRADFGDQNPPEGGQAGFQLVKAGADGRLAAADNIQVTLIREDRQFFWVHDDHDGWHYEYTEKEFPVLSETLDLNAEAPTRVSYAVDWGRYRLEVRDPEAGLLSSLRFFAGADWYADWQQAQSRSGARPDVVKLALDQGAYRGGDTAQLRVIPPEAGEALILVEGERPLWSHHLHVPAAGATVEIPVDPSWDRHDLYISALVLRPGDAENTPVTPKRSLGLIHLPLEREPRRLTLDLQAPETARPNQPLAVTVKLDTPPAGPVQVTLAAVDVGVLNITGFETPDPFEHFFGRRSYGVQARDLYHKLIEVSDADQARIRFGGDSDLSRGGEAPKSEVQILSLFTGPLSFDSDGEARVELDLPYFNGRLRLMAVGFSAERFGSAEREVTVAAPVVSEIALPRFLAYGDRARATLDLNNLSGDNQELSVQLTASGPLELERPDRSLRLGVGERAALAFPLRASGFSGQAELTLHLSGAGIEPVHRSWKLGLRPAYPALLRQQRAVIPPGEAFEAESGLLQGLLGPTVQTRLTLSDRADLDLSTQLENLLQYPYGCLEQTVSRLFPLALADNRNLQRLGLPPLAAEKREKMLQQGLARLATLQLYNGGFGLWDDDSDEEHWLTAFAADFLLSARAQGLAVPDGLLDSAMNRLREYLQRRGSFFQERWSDAPDHYTFAYKAYAGYVLSRTKQAHLGELRTLFEQERGQAKTGLPLVQLGIALLNQGDQKRGLQAIREGLDRPRERDGYYGDYGSVVRDLALQIRLLLEQGIMPERALGLSFTLADELKGQRWLSTQERNALFMAGLSLEGARGAPWAAELALGERRQALKGPGRHHSQPPAAALAQGLRLHNASEVPLFTVLTINGYAEGPPAPSAQGITVKRSYYSPEGEPLALEQAAVGDLVLVHLGLTAEQRVPDALVADLLPAGFELENQNLEHAIKIDDLRIEGQALEELTRERKIQYAGYRDDRYVAALDLPEHGRTHLFYLMRAVTPGTYSVPPTLVESMYRPQIRAVGKAPAEVKVVQP